MKYPVPDWVKQSFVIFDTHAHWRSALSVRMPGWLNPVLHIRQQWASKR